MKTILLKLITKCKPLMNLLIRLDKRVNGLLWGDPRETISSRMGRNMHIKWAYYGCKILSLVDTRHCEKSVKEYDNLDSRDTPIVFLLILVGILILSYVFISEFVL